MAKVNIACCFTTIMLAVLLLFSNTSIGSVQTENPMSATDTWQPPENFVDPVTLKIQEYRTQGLNDDQITTALEKLGMGWLPKTGATWIGRSLTPDEQAKMPIPIPSGENEITEQKTTSIISPLTSLSSKVAYMRTSGSSCTGVSAEIVTGSMNVASGETQKHYLCVQLGDLNGITNWAEIVVTHKVGETYKWYTYDSDESGATMTYYMDKNTPTTSADTFVILLDGTQDNDGWNYDMWINYNWVRSGHLSNLWVQGGFQNEVYSYGQFTNDASYSTFYRNWLHNNGGWFYWTNSISTIWDSESPMQENHYMSTYSYYWNTWVEN